MEQRPALEYEMRIPGLGLVVRGRRNPGQSSRGGNREPSSYAGQQLEVLPALHPQLEAIFPLLAFVRCCVGNRVTHACTGLETVPITRALSLLKGIEVGGTIAQGYNRQRSKPNFADF